jgi:hypothetical protein
MFYARAERLGHILVPAGATAMAAIRITLGHVLPLLGKAQREVLWNE